MSGADHGAVVLPVKGRRPEVDELDPGVAHAPDVALVGGAVLAVPVRAHKQDVLRLQVSVGQVVVMKKLKIKEVQNVLIADFKILRVMVTRAKTNLFRFISVISTE